MGFGLPSPGGTPCSASTTSSVGPSPWMACCPPQTRRSPVHAVGSGGWGIRRPGATPASGTSPPDGRPSARRLIQLWGRPGRRPRWPDFSRLRRSHIGSVGTTANQRDDGALPHRTGVGRHEGQALVATRISSTAASTWLLLRALPWEAPSLGQASPDRPPMEEVQLTGRWTPLSVRHRMHPPTRASPGRSISEPWMRPSQGL